MPEKRTFFVFFILAIVAAAVLFFRHLIGGSTVAVFTPRGPIAAQEKNLIRTAILLMLMVVAPVFTLLFSFAWKYRAGNEKAKYEPEKSHGIFGELVWWAFPAAVVAVLAVITWGAAHALDPYKPLAAAGAKPLTIQVAALNWKWLFIYPEQGIATVNFLEFPERTPLNFELTADAPMNSFWIPQLGGQMYAMAGMVSQLHLMADSAGEYAGRAAEINGRGYAGMKFTAKSVSDDDFSAWVASVKQAPSALTLDGYNRLAEPSENNPAASYSSVEKNLYNTIVVKFMPPASQLGGASATMPNMQMQ